MADLKSLKGIAEKDRRMIEDAETLLGPEPSAMGFVKNLFWGHLREDLVFPYPQQDPAERARCDELLARLDAYLQNEHPSVRIDQEQEIGPGDAVVFAADVSHRYRALEASTALDWILYLDPSA